MTEKPIELFTPGPLNKMRKRLVDELSSIVKTGDIFVRLGNTHYSGFPIEKIIANITKSKYSHASIAFLENNEIYIYEVNDEGSLKLRLIDWIPYVQGEFAVYRIPELVNNTDLQLKLMKTINLYLEKDEDYDFTFNDPNKLYCTESVVQILQDVGIQMPPPMSAKQLMPIGIYHIFLLLNFISKIITKKSFPLTPLYFVGNENQGILSKEGIEQIFNSLSANIANNFMDNLFGSDWNEDDNEEIN